MTCGVDANLKLFKTVIVHVKWRLVAFYQHVLLGVVRVSACRDRASDQHVSHPGGAGDDRPAGTRWAQGLCGVLRLNSQPSNFQTSVSHQTEAGHCKHGEGNRDFHSNALWFNNYYYLIMSWNTIIFCLLLFHSDGCHSILCLSIRISQCVTRDNCTVSHCPLLMCGEGDKLFTYTKQESLNN